MLAGRGRDDGREGTGFGPNPWAVTARPRDLKLTGPVVANAWAEHTSADATLVSVLSDVAPSGESSQITAGFLLAGTMIRPFHPFTRASREPVTPNDPALYRIEIYPTSAISRKGDRIRLTIGSADTPATAPPLPALADSLGARSACCTEVVTTRTCRSRSRPVKPRAARVPSRECRCTLRAHF